MSLPTTLTRGYNRNHNVSFRDETYNASRGSSLWELCPSLPAICDIGEYIVFSDDFIVYDRGVDSNTDVVHLTYTKTEDAGASGANGYLATGAGGVYDITCDGDANDEAYLHMKARVFEFAANKPLWFECRVKVTLGAATGQYVVGMVSGGPAANIIADTFDILAGDYTGAVFYRNDSATTWAFESSKGTTQVTDTNVGAFADTTWVKLGFIFSPGDNTTGSITPYVNGVADTAQAITLASALPMGLVIGSKATSAEESIAIDYWRVVQVR